MADLKAHFPKPCSERWDQMTPRGCNRHCSTCDKTIHDLASLTFEEAEALLDSDQEICARAEIGKDGTVKLANRASGETRRIAALIGATASLALASCTTLDGSGITPRYELSGQTDYYQFGSRAFLTDSVGKMREMPIKSDGSFRFTNLPATSYTLKVSGMCGDIVELGEVIIRDDNVGLQTIEWPQMECIIIGVFQRAEPVRRG
ncbi:hypothetical protein ACFCW2_12335 [Qipengyuania sp. DSG2-2]|uniref:hypothetical protein n=1 Tax=Qipengyuania sp. DGS2-2 TaxID=3349631 RepID=UPI0036D35D38